MYKMVNEMICTSLPHYNSNSLCTMLKQVYVQCLNIRSLKHSSVSQWALATLGQDCQRYRGASGILGGWSEPHSFVQCALSGHSEWPAEAVLS